MQVSVICPVRPDSPYIEGFLDNIIDNTHDRNEVEVILALTLGDEAVKARLEPYKERMRLHWIELDKSLGRVGMHSWLTVLSHMSMGWAIQYLGDDTRLQIDDSIGIDGAYGKFSGYADELKLFYLNGWGDYPGMTKRFFYRLGWGPHYGVSTFLNTVAEKVPGLAVSIPGVRITDLNGERKIYDNIYKEIPYPSPEFDQAVDKFIGGLNGS